MLASCCGSELPSGTSAKRTLVPPMSASNRICAVPLMTRGLFVQYAGEERCEFFRCEAKKLEDFGPRRGFAEAIDTQHRARDPHILAPEIAHAGLDRHARDARRQN